MKRNQRGRIRDASIQTKLTVLAATAISLAVTVACVAFVVLDMKRNSISKATQLLAFAEILATNSSAAVAFEQQDAATELLRSAQRRDQLLLACIFDQSGRVFAIHQRKGQRQTIDPTSIQLGANYTDQGYLDAAVQIRDGGDLAGTLFLRESTEELQNAYQYRILIASIVLVFSVVIGVTVSWRLQEHVSSPILRLAAAAEQISNSKDYSIRVWHENHDEIGILYRQFNKMLRRIESREQTIVRTSEKLQRLNEELEQRVAERTSELEASNSELKNQIHAKDAATQQLQKTHAQLLDVSRRAGMADIANGVLHNIGNVLNSLNISANLINDRLRTLGFDNLEKAVSLLAENEDHLDVFLTESEQGKILPQYLGKLSGSLRSEQFFILSEVESLAASVEHIKEIVRAQQSHAGAFGVTEMLDPRSLFEDAVCFVQDSIQRHDIEIVKDFDPTSRIAIEKTKAIQILVNLIKNAKEAVIERKGNHRQVRLRLRQLKGHVSLSVADNGIGISSECLTTIFSNGFTTKTDGHGFGLHASATAATELGGKLTVNSDGVGKGATFTLVLPVAQQATIDC